MEKNLDITNPPFNEQIWAVPSSATPLNRGSTVVQDTEQDSRQNNAKRQLGGDTVEADFFEATTGQRQRGNDNVSRLSASAQYSPPLGFYFWIFLPRPFREGLYTVRSRGLHCWNHFKLLNKAILLFTDSYRYDIILFFRLKSLVSTLLFCRELWEAEGVNAVAHKALKSHEWKGSIGYVGFSWVP